MSTTKCIHCFGTQPRRRVLVTSLAICFAAIVPALAWAQPTISSGSGYSITFNGNQQAFFSATWDGTSQQAPNNVALSGQGSTAFASSQFGGAHQTTYANDGVYGNSRSWLPLQSGTQAYVGIAFPTSQSLSSIAWGRDNGRNSTAIASGGGGDTAVGGASGQFTDRSAGTYTLQFTTVASPGTSTVDGNWTTIGTITLGSVAAGSFSPWFRHEFDVRTSAGAPIAGVTGVRIINTVSQVIDEIEVYRTAYWTAGSAAWSASNAWQTASSGGTSATPFSGDFLAFAQAAAGTQAVTLGAADRTARALSFTTADPVSFAAGGIDRALTLGWVGDLTTSSTASTSTLVMGTASGGVTIGSQTVGEQVAISLTASQAWRNDSANLLTVNNSISRIASDTTSRILTIAGTGNSAIAGGIANGGSAGTLGLAKSGAGTLTLSGSNAFTGGSTVSEGTLLLTATSAQPASGLVSVSSGATLALAVGGTGQYATSNFVTLMTGSLTNVSMASGAVAGIDTSAGSQVITDSLGGARGLAKIGSNTLTLTGSNAYTGGTRIAAGTLVVGSTNALGATTGTLAMTGGTLDLADRSLTVGGLTGLSGAMITSSGPGSSGLTVNASNSGTYAGTIAAGSGTLAFWKAGLGTLTLSGSNAHTGSTTVSAGTLVVANADAIGAAASSLSVGSGTLDLGGFNILKSSTVQFTGASTVRNGTITKNSGIFDLQGGTVSASLSGSAGITKTSANAITLSGSNAFTGVAQINRGTVTLANVNALAATGSIQFGFIDFGDAVPTGVLQFTGSNTVDYSSRIVNSSAAAVSIDTNGQAVTFASGLAASNTRGLVKLGAGTLTLSGSNSYSGGTTITAGTLQLGAGGASGSINGNVANNATLAFNRADSSTFSGAISGSGSVIKAGPGQVVLTTDHTYSGGTTILAGTLQLGAGGTAGSILGNVVNDGVLAFNRAGSVAFGGAIIGSGSIVNFGPGTVFLSGSIGSATSMQVGNGRVVSANPAALGSATVTVASGGRFDIGGSQANAVVLSGGTLGTLGVTLPSGGAASITADGLYGVNVFTTTGTSTFSGFAGAVEVLLVGGGGGGGAGHAGGGGGGGFLETTATAAAGGNTIVVGDGGVGGALGFNPGANGGASSAFGLSALGGGGGGSYMGVVSTPGNGQAGGSGGGGGGSKVAGTGGAGAVGEGSNGGNGTTNATAGGGGGGGGALASGSNASGLSGGRGGDGKVSSITGAAVTYAGGGGGGGWIGFTVGVTSGAGGLGGGGSGGDLAGVVGVAGTDGLGGGGGGGTNFNPGGGRGGSGVVVVRYALSSLASQIQTLSGSITVNALSTLDGLKNGAGLELTGAVNGAGGLSIASSAGAGGRVIFGGAAKSYAGPTLINSGADLRVNSDNSLATGEVTVNGRLGGSGILGGTVTINSGGVLAPGNSIESLSTGALSFADGATYEYEIDSSLLLSVGADFTKALGSLSLAGTVNLSIADLAGSPTAFAPGTTFSLVNYTGSWNNGLFTVGGSQVADGGTFTVGLNTWQLDYNASSGGSNYTADYTTGSFVNIVVVPEPAALATAILGMACGAAAFRRRKK